MNFYDFRTARERDAPAIFGTRPEQGSTGLSQRLSQRVIAGPEGPLVSGASSADNRWCEPFILDGNRRADWRAGWCREYKEFSQQQGMREVGWRVVFEVFDIGPARHVVANVQGESERNEVKRFVQHVFDRLAQL